MAKTKLVVRLKEGASPERVFLAKSRSTVNTPLSAFELKPLYDITNDVQSFKLRNMGLASTYDSDAELFQKEIYRKKPENEKKLFRTFTIDVETGQEAERIMNELKASKDIEYVQMDTLNELYYVPNDPLLGNLWGLHKINCGPAWNVSQGQGIAVAVVDTGVDYTHPDISGNMWRDANGNVGYNFSDNNADPRDYHGHGTHVAGTIAAVGNNSIGIVGVAPKVKVMALRIFPNAWDSVCARAIVYAADNGARVINNSWGPTGRRPVNEVIRDAINYALSKNVVVVFAAGNSNDDVRYYAPANHPHVISVAATDMHDNRASFSNYGKVSVSAPGVNILSLQGNGIGYVSMNGTSMAAPHVAGLASLVLKCNPSLTPAQVKRLIELNADAIKTDRPLGRGRINAFRTVNVRTLKNKRRGKKNVQTKAVVRTK